MAGKHEKEGYIVPYHKNKIQAFQSAQNGVRKATDVHQQVVQMKNDAEFAHELSHLWEEVNEAYQQIENAYEVASEHQREQLNQYRQTLEKIVTEMKELDGLR